MILLLQVISPNSHIISDYDINSQSITKVIRKVEDTVIKAASLNPFNRILLLNASIDSYTYVKVTPYNINFKHTGFYLCNINDKEPEYKYIGDHVIDMIEEGYHTICVDEFKIKISTHRKDNLVKYKRLQALQDHLYNLQEKKANKIFDFDYFRVTKERYIEVKYERFLTNEEQESINYCDTIGCAAGELPAIDKNWKFAPINRGSYDLYYKKYDRDLSVTDYLKTYFNMSTDDIDVIFYPAGEREAYNSFLEDKDIKERFIVKPNSFGDVAHNIEVYLQNYGIIQNFDINNYQ